MTKKIVNEYQFFRNVNHVGDCWEWAGDMHPDGYGLVRYHGKQYQAHRLSLILYLAEEPYALSAGHTCDNKACINPKHLQWVSHKRNMEDKKRLYPNGYLNGKCKRGHEKTKGKKDCADCAGLKRAADKYFSGEQLTEANLKWLYKEGLDMNDPDFEEKLRRFQSFQVYKNQGYRLTEKAKNIRESRNG